MKNIFQILLITLALTASNFSQILYPVKFEKQDSTINIEESCILKIGDGDLLLFWHELYSLKIFYSRSTDNGLTWLDKKVIAYNSIDTVRKHDIDAIVKNDGTILFIYRYGVHYLKYSTDNGISWSDSIALPTRDTYLQRLEVANPKLNLLSDGKIALTYNYMSKGIFAIYSNDGIIWTPIQTIDPNGITGSIISIKNNQELLVYSDSLSNYWNLVYRISTDKGATWSNKMLLLSSSYNDKNPRGVIDSNDKIWIYFERKDETSFPEFTQSEIYYITSIDNGVSWSEPEKFTDYAGKDFNHSVTLHNDTPLITFVSSRSFQIGKDYTQIYYGNEPDINTPPFLYYFYHEPEIIQPNEQVTIKAYVDDNSSVDSVKVIIIKNVFTVDTLIMYDDGMHSDLLSNDKIYGIEIEGFNKGDGVLYNFLIYDDESNIAGFKGGEINIPLDFFTRYYVLDINRFKLPFGNSGIIADIYYEGLSNGWYDESRVLFSGGFFVTGKIGNDIWATCQASASRISDYQPGIVGSSPDDPKNQLYNVKASDPHFGQSWQNYSYAVMLGAKFYDGNSDGIYNPVDLNGNCIWDLNEDRPDMLGDETLWCVYNDGIPSELRSFSNMYPLGLEIKQTVFALGENLTGPIENMFFIRYIITNTGTIVQEIDSVFFSGWADPDIGFYYDDLVGCDTLLNTGYAYNAGYDDDYGVNAPAIGISLLQGGVTYLTGETFIDNNHNEIYDAGIDTPLDTAFVNNGLFIGSDIFPGARNTILSSFAHYQKSDPFLGDPYDEIETRFYSTGYTRIGEIIDPCTWHLSEVRGGVDCNLVNPFYWYSGDPVTDIGWINTNPTDQRIVTSTGSFKLKANEPVELWFAYVVGRGVDSLNSVTKMKEHVEYAIKYYKSNFTYLPSDVLDEIFMPGEFALYQNYPNPFNPNTVIGYQLPVNGKVTLRIFDILGREIITLVNEEKPSGTYEVEFNAAKFASGVYFYQLKTGNYMDTKKMVLIK